MRSAAKRSDSMRSARQPIGGGGDFSRDRSANSIEIHAIDALRPIAQGGIAAIAHIGQNLGHRFSRGQIAPEDAAQTLLQRIGQGRFRLAAIENRTTGLL